MKTTGVIIIKIIVWFIAIFLITALTQAGMPAILNIFLALGVTYAIIAYKPQKDESGTKLNKD
jgi:hypothetical protein